MNIQGRVMFADVVVAPPVDIDKKNKHTHNYRKVLDHIRGLTANIEECPYSHRRQPEAFNSWLVQQWQFVRSDFELEGDTCPCGVRIMEKCFIRHKLSLVETYVGNECIRHFDDEFNGIARVARSLRTKGIAVTYDGPSCCGKPHIHVEGVTRAHALFKEEPHLVAHFKKIPTQVGTRRFRVELGDYLPSPALVAGERYRLYLKLVRHPAKSQLYLHVTRIAPYTDEIPYNDPQYLLKIEKLPDHVAAVSGDQTFIIHDALKAAWPGQSKWSGVRGAWLIKLRAHQTMHTVRYSLTNIQIAANLQYSTLLKPPKVVNGDYIPVSPRNK
jgi:hypothetical protein